MRLHAARLFALAALMSCGGAAMHQAAPNALHGPSVSPVQRDALDTGKLSGAAPGPDSGRPSSPALTAAAGQLRARSQGARGGAPTMRLFGSAWQGWVGLGVKLGRANNDGTLVWNEAWSKGLPEQGMTVQDETPLAILALRIAGAAPQDGDTVAIGLAAEVGADYKHSWRRNLASYTWEHDTWVRTGLNELGGLEGGTMWAPTSSGDRLLPDVGAPEPLTPPRTAECAALGERLVHLRSPGDHLAKISPPARWISNGRCGRAAGRSRRGELYVVSTDVRGAAWIDALISRKTFVVPQASCASWVSFDSLLHTLGGEPDPCGLSPPTNYDHYFRGQCAAPKKQWLWLRVDAQPMHISTETPYNLVSGRERVPAPTWSLLCQPGADCDGASGEGNLLYYSRARSDVTTPDVVTPDLKEHSPVLNLVSELAAYAAWGKAHTDACIILA